MKNIRQLLADRKHSAASYAIVIIGFLVIQSMILTGNISSSLKGQLVPICAYIVMAVSLNLTVGILGELSLGHAGFMSVGAFTGIVVSTSLAEAIPNGPIRLAVSMAVAGLFAGVAGLIVEMCIRDRYHTDHIFGNEHFQNTLFLCLIIHLQP